MKSEFLILVGALLAIVSDTRIFIVAGFAMVIAGCVSLVINPPITQRLKDK